MIISILCTYTNIKEFININIYDINIYKLLLEYLQILISMILIFIRYSDVSIPSRLSWDVKEKAWLGQLIGQASSHANPAQALLP